MKAVIIALIIALMIVGGLLYASQIDNAKSKGLLAIQEEQKASLESQINLYESLTDQYEIQVLQLEGEVDFYKEEAQYWREEAAFRGVDQQTDKLREFSSVAELEQWLADDPISEHKPIPKKYDCDDFAIDLTLSALADGYWIGLGVREWHMFNFTVIGNDIYKIEATTDEVEFWGLID